MKGWINIGSDVSWDEYGGKWAHGAADGSFYVLDFTNMWNACGEEECKADGQPRYVCEVKRVDLADLPQDTIRNAMRSCGLRFTAEGIVSDQGDIIAGPDSDHYPLVLVEACVGYGASQPLDSFSGDSYPNRVRAKARRSAEALMRDATALSERLDRPVNKIGSTAREYARGDIDAALSRGPFDASKNLMRKLHGMTPGNEGDQS